MSKFDTQKIANQIKALIEKTLADENTYNTAKKAFLANNAFLNRAFAPITEVLMDEFIETLFMGEEISLNVSILDVEKNENAEFSDYSTVIRAGLYTGLSSSSAFATITLYTNDTALTRLRQSDKTLLSGQFVRLEKTILSPRLIMIK